MTDKALPLGIENYEIACSCYYVDKTAMLQTLMDLPLTTALLISRPRRFGKSLALSMVESFFSPSKGNPELFRDKKIWSYGEKYTQQIGSCPVVRLNLKDVTASTYEGLVEVLSSDIADCYRANVDRNEPLNDEEQEEFASLLRGKPSPALLARSLLLLTRHLAKKGTKPILLIDEYDAPIILAKSNGFYEPAIELFKSLYGSVLKGNDSIRFALLTGTSEISKDSLFSGVNNLRVHSPFDDGFDEDFGFTETEVKGLLEAYGIQQPLDIVRSYYGGYRFGEATLFNPWSILSFVHSGGKFRPYWTNTGSNALIAGALTAGDNAVVDTLSQLLSGECVPVMLDSSVSFHEIDRHSSGLYSLLVQSGYLTFKNIGDFGQYALFLPNRETTEVFRREIMQRYVRVGEETFALSLKEAFLAGDERAVGDLFGRYILSCFSYFDFPDYRNYQALVLGAVAILFDYATVKSEVNAGLGRCDILVSPKNKSLPAFIIEVKQHGKTFSSARLKGSAAAAIKQIRRRSYIDELVRNGYSDIRLCGFAFKATLVQVAIEKA